MRRSRIEDTVATTASQLPKSRIAELLEENRSKSVDELVPEARIQKRRVRLSEAAFRPAPVDFERILGENDLVDVNYLSRALRACRSVCRVVLRAQTGRVIGYGTGFKVSPNLVMTNHHVLESAADAETALVEFDYELDLVGMPRATTRFELRPGDFFLSDQGLDFTLVGVAPQALGTQRALSEFGYLRMIRETGKINRGEFVTIVQHPGGRPKQIALRENELLSIEERVLWYQSDTAPGSSGSPVFNDSWQIVGLHHSGVPKTDAAGNWLLKDGSIAGADADDSDIAWLANEGIRASRIVNFVENTHDPSPLATEFLRHSDGSMPGTNGTGGVPVDGFRDDSETSPDAPGAARVEPIQGGARITLPISFTVSLNGVLPATAGHSDPGVKIDTATSTIAAIEATRFPIIDTHYSNRRGYSDKFLDRDLNVPLPTVRAKSKVVKLDNGDHVIPYQNFSIVLDKARRMALYTAANVDGREKSRRPDPDKTYTRKALGGFGPNDREKWLVDPRVPPQFQLPDNFYNKDRQAFDKGHLVRRDAVCFGRTYKTVERANGDTYHVTNCSPQVNDFNQSRLQGIWGKLENLVLKQAATEKYCVFSGPMFRDDDPLFKGFDDVGAVEVRIPRSYWKIIVAVGDQGLEAFAFSLVQDLTNVDFEASRTVEFDVSDEWIERMVPIEDLEEQIGNIRFAKAIKDADMFGTATGNELLAVPEAASIEMAGVAGATR